MRETRQYEHFPHTLDPGSIPGISTIRLAPSLRERRSLMVVIMAFANAMTPATFLVSARRMTLSNPEHREGESKSPTKHTKNMLRYSAMSWHLYIAQAPTGRYYTGITENPQQRIVTHNAGMGAKFAYDQGALRLLYVSPSFPDKSSARKREMQIKKWTREKKEKLIRCEAPRPHGRGILRPRRVPLWRNPP